MILKLCLINAFIFFPWLEKNRADASVAGANCFQVWYPVAADVKWEWWY